eukprot:TRINITY_DN80840_c0_g1_i1.p1 TRINITY_DN80840_c0_g1~~TRINITY_DN80840_c0_g1_i1.p1  ORF type:complete len:622 (-),score=159.03 TRINITY_DN80840_c0_g1_i1:155-1927(-)
MAPEAAMASYKGRSVAVVNDLTLSEQWFLYQKTRELKEAINNGGNLAAFRLNNSEATAYLIFMENSTRTKESFRNAAEFHSMKVNVFDCSTSSFQKNETITDTIKMLCGYSTGQSLFIIRSKVEGVCTWLDESIGNDFATRHGLPRPSFINAGDGRHEHPSQELLDEFSFLEHKGWDTESIHLALIGDLFHGRTVHSKVDGLKLYKKVEVDLVAPQELELPADYEDRMLASGFVVRKFGSIAEYLAQGKVSKIWYFTRLQLERMGDKVLTRAPALRKAVTFQKEFVDKLPKGTKFFHPLPRDAKNPELPFWLDGTDLNGWDQQSRNGYFTRIVLLAMLSGKLSPADAIGSPPQGYHGSSVAGMPPPSPSIPLMSHMASEKGMEMLPTSMDEVTSPIARIAGDFIAQVDVPKGGKEEDHLHGLAPIVTGVVVDRLGVGASVDKIWSLMYKVKSVLGMQLIGGMAVYTVKEDGVDVQAGVISIPNLDMEALGRSSMKKLAAIAPSSTLAVINQGTISMKFELHVPPRIYNFPDISCKNEGCISNPSNMQHEVRAYFLRVKSNDKTQKDPWLFSCKYCERVHTFAEVWDYRMV